MLIATWNVNSVRTRLAQIINWINQVNPDVLCLQETKVVDKDFPSKSFEELGYSVLVYGQKSYNGVAIISKIKPDLIIRGFNFNFDFDNDQDLESFKEQKRLISAQINGIRIINVYVPNGSSLNSEKFTYKIKWLNYLASFLNRLDKKGELICLLGDFNIAPTNLDIHNPQKYEGGIMATEIERKALQNVLKEGFIDTFRIYEQNSGYWSWWDYRNNAYESNKGWRIDHIYLSKRLTSKLKSCVIDSNPRGNIQPSDHAPVMINVDLESFDADYDDSEEDLFEI